MIHLDERLSMLAALTPACRMAADIGADHGLLGAWLLESGKCGRLQFMDISGASLSKARRLIDRLGLNDRCFFGVGDGADAMTEPADAVIISGMGEETISGIIERGQNRFGNAVLILQPNLDADRLRRRVAEMGYYIADEALCRAGRRWYTAMAVRRGFARYTPAELLAGPVLLKRKNPLLEGYIRFRLTVQTKALQGALRGKSERAEELADEIALWKEIEKWLACPTS